MKTPRPVSWVPLGVLAALLLTLAVAWSFRERLSRTVTCATLYAAAATAADSAAVDTLVVARRGDAPVTCADVP